MRSIEVGLLGGRELLVEDDDVGIERADHGDELLDLALADERLGNRGVEALRHRENDLGAVSLGKAGELRERLLAAPLRPSEVNAHKNRTLGNRGG